MATLEPLIPEVLAGRFVRHLEHEGPKGVYTDWNIVPERDASGSATAVILSGRDISAIVRVGLELRKAKETADEANYMKSRFVSNISHEIRTPLNGIIGFGEIVIETGSIEEAHRGTMVILDEANTLLRLVNDLLDSAKIESGKLELDLRPMDLRKLFSVVKRVASLKASRKGLEFTIEVGEDVPCAVIADELRLRQILFNLVVNAIKFTESGSVALRVEPSRGLQALRARVDAARPPGGPTGRSGPFRQGSAACIYRSSTPGSWIAWVRKNRGCTPFAVPASALRTLSSARGSRPAVFGIPRAA